MSHETEPAVSQVEVPVTRESSITKSLNVLRQRRDAAAIALAATTLAVILSLANAKPVNSDGSIGDATLAPNPVTIDWAPDVRTADLGKIIGSFATVGLLIIVAGALEFSGEDR